MIERMKAQFTFLEEGGRVQRYHTLDVLHTQTVAEHIYGVLSILTVLRDHQVSQPLFLAALTHDAPEAITGDIPAPTKRQVRKRLPGEDFFGVWEQEIFAEMQMEEVNYAQMSLRPDEERHLKIADILEGLRYCQRERNLGNSNIGIVAERYADYLLEHDPTERELILAQHLAPTYIPLEES